MLWVTLALEDLHDAKAESDLTKTQYSQVNNEQDKLAGIEQKSKFLCVRMKTYAKRGQNVIYVCGYRGQNRGQNVI